MKQEDMTELESRELELFLGQGHVTIRNKAG